MSELIAPYGGELKELYLSDPQAAEVEARARRWPSWELTARQLCDLELLLNGGFSPLTGFMTRSDYDQVVSQSRLADGTLWPMPITLDVSQPFAERVSTAQHIALREPGGVLIALLEVQDVWTPDRQAEAREVLGTLDPSHPGVDHLLNHTHPVYLGGTVRGIRPPAHADFTRLRHTPRGLRECFRARGWQRIVAFQTRNPMHRAHQEITLRAARQADANLLVHPAVGRTRPGDIDYQTRVRCYEHVLKRYPEHTTMLSLLPLAMRMAGPREALWHAIIRRNFGCTHFVIGRDHAGPGRDSRGREFYGPLQAQEYVRAHEAEIGIRIVPMPEMVYVRELDRFVSIDEVRPGHSVESISATELRRRLRAGLEIPAWFSWPEVVEELRRTCPPPSQPASATAGP